MLLFLLACQDYKLAFDNPGADGLDTGGRDSVPVDTDTGTLPAEEVCNGLDDDGDGEVDEGFPDADANGRADCQDASCPPLDAPAAGPVDSLGACWAPATLADPWAVRTLWEAPHPSTLEPQFNGVAVPPVVGQLNDDDGDGDVDSDDDVDIVVPVYADFDYFSAVLVAIDGPTGVTRWEVEGVMSVHGVVIADIDVDGQNDIVTVSAAGEVMALNGDGSPKWTSSVVLAWYDQASITVVDWDLDGAPEVSVRDILLDGATGAVRLDSGLGIQFSVPAFADIDLDGTYEMIGNGFVMNHDGSTRWSSGRSDYASWPLAVQFDADPEAEVAFVGATLSIHDTDGTLLAEAIGGGLIPGSPALGDFDGDGEEELCWPVNSTLRMMELDASTSWSIPVEDPSSFAGCSGVDLDGDGALEVLYTDESQFLIVDGRTGDVLHRATGRTSVTISEYPVPVDLDHDGHTEIVVASNGIGGWGALRAFTHDGAGWTAGARTWGVHDYRWDNVGDDGSVASTPATDWETELRACPAAGAPLADLTVAFTDVCVGECGYGPVALALQVSNVGLADVPAGATLALYADERLVGERVLGAIPAATAAAAESFALTPADVPAVGWRALVVTTAEECDSTNNEARYTDAVCP